MSGKPTSPLLRKQQIRLPRRTQIADPIAGIEHRRPLRRVLLEILRVRTDRQALVVAETTYPI